MSTKNSLCCSYRFTNLKEISIANARWIYKYVSKSKVGDLSRGQPEGSLFDSYYTKVLGRVLLLFLDCSTLPLIPTLYCWVLSKEAASIIFWAFGMTLPGIEPSSPGSLVNTGATIITCLSLIVLHRWQFKMWEVFLYDSHTYSQTSWCMWFIYHLSYI